MRVRETETKSQRTAKVRVLVAFDSLAPDGLEGPVVPELFTFSCNTLSSTQDPSNEFPFENDSLSCVSAATRKLGQKDINRLFSEHWERQGYFAGERWRVTDSRNIDYRSYYGSSHTV